MTNPLRFGIVGTGKIAGSFAGDFPKVAGAELVAVASRSQESAEQFAHDHDIARAHGSYEALADDPDVDVVYVATPHSRHADDTCLLLDQGKHVLCEKPFALNAAQSARMIERAEANDRFLMEAMWARFSPSWIEGKKQLEAGAIGDPRVLSADFCIPAPADPSHRLRNPDLGGGSLLDLGVYPLGLAWFLFGEPDTLDARSVVADGIDQTTALLAGYDDGVMAQLVTSVVANVSIGATLIGSTGTITWDMPFHSSGAITVTNTDGQLRIETPDNGLHRQTQHVVDCITEGRNQSDVVPHSYTLAMMSRLDAVRAEIGLYYPGED
ncbi:MAG: Gfo/Idh/MocA family protein [Acidimicrobiales bacterium]